MICNESRIRYNYVRHLHVFKTLYDDRIGKRRFRAILNVQNGHMHGVLYNTEQSDIANAIFFLIVCILFSFKCTHRALQYLLSIVYCLLSIVK